MFPPVPRNREPSSRPPVCLPHALLTRSEARMAPRGLKSESMSLDTIAHVAQDQINAACPPLAMR